MRRKAVSVIMLTLLLASMLTLTFRIELIFAFVPPEPEYPAIYVDPPVVEGIMPGDNVTVSIETNCTEPIQAWQFYLSFNASILHGVNVTNGDLLIPGLPFFTFVTGTFNNTEGTLSLTGAFWYPHIGPPPITPPSGPGTLANVTFTVVGYGCSNITLGPNTQYIGYDPGDPELQPYSVIDAETMPDHLGHGYFNNMGEGGDVAVTDVMQWFKYPPVTDEAYSTWPINLNVTVENVGNVTVSCNVSVYYDSIPIATQTVTDLVASEIRTLTLIGDISGLDPGKNPGVYYTLKANATTIGFPDFNLADNEFVYGQVKIRRWGDVNGDDAIDVLDLKKDWLTYSGWIWEPFADLDGNCVVNILDLKKMKLIYSGILP